MATKISALSARVMRLLGSKRCWWIIFGLFVLEAIWFVCSAQYPMAFDENYHFGLIKLHAAQWLPFFTAQPHNASVYGAVVRDPSYLYHWLMSFPYRLTALFTTNQTAQIIVLRLLNVALFAYGLTLYRRVIRKLGASPALTNCLFAVFILVPVVPFLAAHINYDNLFFVAIAATVLLTLRLLDGFREQRVDAAILLLLVAVMFFSSLIKYPYLPILVVACMFVIWRAYKAKLLNSSGWKLFRTHFMSLSMLRRVVLIVGCLLAIGMFTERYGENIITYHNPVPACDAVISEDECSQYGPYGRDKIYKAEKPASFHANVFGYAWQWLYGMWYRLFFAISYDYATAPPLLVVSVLAVGLAALTLLGIAVRAKALFVGQPGRQLVLWLCLGYTLALFADGFSAYRKTGQPVAINGRYLIPFLPLIFALGGIAWSQLLRRYSTAKTVVASLVIAIFLLQGGGTMTWIIRSSDTWMWPNTTVRSVNRTVRSAAWPFVLGKGTY